MKSSYKEKPSYRFPSKLDMLARFGLDPEVEDESLASVTYRFDSIDAIAVIVTYSFHMHFVDVTMYVGEHEVFSIATNDVAEMPICEGRGLVWLQVSFEEARRMPDLFIHVEPKVSCRWG